MKTQHLSRQGLSLFMSLETRIGTNSNVLKYGLHFQFDEWSIWNRWPWIRITQADNLFVVVCFINKYSYTIFLGLGGMRGVHCTKQITHRYKNEVGVLEDIKCIKLTVIWLKGCIFCEISQKNVSIFPFFFFYSFLSFMKCKSLKDHMGRIYVCLLLIYIHNIHNTYTYT